MKILVKDKVPKIWVAPYFKESSFPNGTAVWCWGVWCRRNYDDMPLFLYCSFTKRAAQNYLKRCRKDYIPLL